jgi:hypothetical protein
MATPLWECIGFGGFHIDFALVLLVAALEREENNLIKKKKLWNIISVKQLTTVSKMQ